MNFRKQHFEFVAALVRDMLAHASDYGPDADEILTRIALRAADRFAATSPTFDRERFLRACGIVNPANVNMLTCKNCGRVGMIYWRGAKGHSREAYCSGCDWVLDPQPRNTSQNDAASGTHFPPAN